MQSDEDERGSFGRAEVSVEALSPFYKAQMEEAALHE